MASGNLQLKRSPGGTTLVTGGAGFIGSNLVDELVRIGHQVIVVDDYSTGLKANENAEVKYFHYDLQKLIMDASDLREILVRHNVKTVYHLAASADVSLSMNFPEKVYSINTLASIALLSVCSSAGVEKFAFASTSAVYGEPRYLPVDLSHPTAPISPYGLSKLAFEQYIQYFSRQSSIQFITFRLPNVYGSRQRSDLEGGAIAIFQSLIEAEEPVTVFGDGDQSRDWVEVSDIVRAFVGAFSKGKNGIYVIGSGVGVTINQTLQIMREIKSQTFEINYSAERSGDIKHMVMSPTDVFEELEWKTELSFRDGLKKLFGAK